MLSVALPCVGLSLAAQSYGSYTPYSIFGVGDLSEPGSAYNKSMAGTGIATRNHRFLNTANPAAVTARDSLAFMVDVSMFQDNKFFRQADMKSVSNTTGIGNLAISFPIWRSSAMTLGIRQFSSTGYSYGYRFEDPSVIGHTGNVTYTATGRGSIYQAYVGAGATFWRRLSIGAEFLLYFGNTKKTFTESFAESSYNGASNGHNIRMLAPAGRFGIQYEIPVGKSSSITAGAVYRTSAKLSGNVESYRFSSGSAASDTLYYRSGAPMGVSIASEAGVGLAFRSGDKFSAEFNYTRSDWRGTALDVTEGFVGNLVQSEGHSKFGLSVADSYRLGFEFTPNRNDIRYYFKRVTYRAGAYYKNDYFTVDGHGINAFGITLGATLPVFRWYNGITIGMDFGQRASTAGNLIRERYINFSIGFNLFDIWFQQPRYD